MSQLVSALYYTAVSLLASQYNKPNMLAVVQSLCGDVFSPDPATMQGFVAATDQTVSSRSLPAAEGVQLDGIGDIVGLKRPDGAADSAYRALLYIQIALLRSSGTYDQVYGATALMSTPVGGTTPKINIVEMFPASLDILVYQSSAAINPSIRAAMAGASAASVSASVSTTGGSESPFRFGGTIVSGALALNGLTLIVNGTDFIEVSATYEEQSNTDGFGVGTLVGRL